MARGTAAFTGETFTAMNTRVTVLGARGLRPWFRAVEATLSRFDPASPLSRLNAAAGGWVVVPPLLYHAIRHALHAALLTDGAFDPTVLHAVEATGYRRSFELGPLPDHPPVPAGRWREVRLRAADGAVRLPPGVGLDLGGVGKGLAVDGALHRLADTAPVVVDAGGDVGVRATPWGPPVMVEVAHPLQPRRLLARLPLSSGAVATSSILRRRWGPGLHHIIDPRTGRPARAGVVTATVLAGRAAVADVLATACIVLGVGEGIALLQEHGCGGILVTDAGRVAATPGLGSYLDV